MRRKNIHEISNFIAEELCRRVGAVIPHPEGKKYETGDFTWTQEEEDSFREWTFDYLYSIPMFKRMGKKRIRKEVDWIIFQFSWKIKERE